MPGPAPTPTAILEARGSRRANARKAEPKPLKGEPPIPPHIKASKRARAIWRQTVADLEALGTLSRTDGGVIAGYVTALERWEAAEAVIADMGFVALTHNGTPITHPALTTANKALEQINRFAQQLGLTPASRSRVQASQPGDDRKSYLAGKYFSPNHQEGQ